ncbi:thermolysin metallopeptidase, alpha-helical domain-containing protein [Sarocladium implicatum]|nr:thermolysin metallopeptidase, alpha-helical domain-containing protein [Sarocladium implicatum]
MSCRCYIVPPHLLRAIADSTANSESIRKAAQASIAARERVTAVRQERIANLARPRGYSRSSSVHFAPRHIVPEALLRHVAESDQADEATRNRARRDLSHLEQVLERVRNSQQGLSPEQQTLFAAEEGRKNTPKDKPYRAVYTMHNKDNEADLPGQMLRAEGEPQAKDKAANEAFDNVGIVLDFYKEQYKWKSIDNENSDVISTVHFGEAYENAFWDPEKFQMVFGDGDEFLNNFTGCIDVIGHELTHAITEHTSPLDYFGQPGALNEHVSDVFGIMIKQKVQDEDSEHADWLIGEDCILPGVKGTALRSMKAPGTAYDDPRFGKDPQVANMSQYRIMFEDNGGVHIYSGIPNRAFYLAAKSFGGHSWEKAGQIWWKTMNSGRVPTKCTFKQFADVTIDIAEEEFDKEAAQKVRKAWAEVGISRGTGG